MGTVADGTRQPRLSGARRRQGGGRLELEGAHRQALDRHRSVIDEDRQAVPTTEVGFPNGVLALLWQIVFSPLFFADLLSAIWALLRRRPKDEIDDGVTYCGH
ncbi:hypothetical protein, partial [Bradyrhizobium uaiense]|uniref:hypothetical protein n=1 Tax=Bradyrhizobium uaiense TaxID=2594946 RepID=UPI0019D63C31